MREPLAEEPAPGSRFPAAFRPPAFASRVFLRPLGDSASLTVGLPAAINGRTPSGLSRSACARYGRGGCPLYPGDGGALPASSDQPAGTCRLPAAGPYLPPAASHRRESFMTRRHRGFTHVHPSGLPQPVTPGWDRSPRALPWASHPAVTRSARQGGDSPLRTGPETTSPTSADPPSTRSAHRMRPRVARHPGCMVSPSVTPMHHQMSMGSSAKPAPRRRRA